MLYAIAPTMEYCAKFGIEDKEYIKRIYHLFSNIAKYSDVGRYKDEKDYFVPDFTMQSTS